MVSVEQNPALSNARVHALMTELLEGFSSKSFQRKLDNIVQKALETESEKVELEKGQPFAMLAGRQELAFSVQKDVIGPEGVWEVFRGLRGGGKFGSGGQLLGSLEYKPFALRAARVLIVSVACHSWKSRADIHFMDALLLAVVWAISWNYCPLHSLGSSTNC